MSNGNPFPSRAEDNCPIEMTLQILFTLRHVFDLESKLVMLLILIIERIYISIYRKSNNNPQFLLIFKKKKVTARASSF